MAGSSVARASGSTRDANAACSVQLNALSLEYQRSINCRGQLVPVAMEDVYRRRMTPRLAAVVVEARLMRPRR